MNLSDRYLEYCVKLFECIVGVKGKMWILKLGDEGRWGQ